jgi:hypothetical protein
MTAPSDTQEVHDSIAENELDEMLDKLDTVCSEVPGLNAERIRAIAVRETVFDVLTSQDLTTREYLANSQAAKIQDMLDNLGK